MGAKRRAGFKSGERGDRALGLVLVVPFGDSKPSVRATKPKTNHTVAVIVVVVSCCLDTFDIILLSGHGSARR